ncbi:hypothetical protein OUZ56_021996 [Daphnia magna]|uniref:Secreted protein n=1 Tax=Daphnia magna TaxID=35525 RepID=A0ABR0AV20_9CRUS|nr:hypothetical protein OUZ56_021996 [Daphnia magna]
MNLRLFGPDKCARTVLAKLVFLSLLSPSSRLLNRKSLMRKSVEPSRLLLYFVAVESGEKFKAGHTCNLAAILIAHQTV